MEDELMRKLLILSTAAIDESLMQAVTAADWDSVQAQEPSEARLALAHGFFRVGLIVLAGGETESSLQWVFDAVQAHPKMQWVIVLPRAYVDRKRISGFVVEHCYDYQTLPVNIHRLINTLGHAYGMVELAESYLQQQGDPEVRMGHVGNSEAIQTLLRRLQKAAEADVPVLLTGEVGTGKEHAARSIHGLSARAAGPFVTVSCVATPVHLLLSELFGHKKGAFAGADADRIGHIEQASGGTIFLDEINDLPQDVQLGLLQLMEEQKIRPVGATQTLPARVRIITAMSVSGEQAVREGRLREDLFYRLSVVHISLPPLRDRLGDTELLARFFFKKFAAEAKTAAKGFSREALETISYHDWPGNIRELMNRVRRAVLLSEGPYIVPADLELERRAQSRVFMTIDEARTAADRETISAALLRTRFNIARAAQDLGISRMTLYRLMEKCNIQRE